MANVTQSHFPTISETSIQEDTIIKTLEHFEEMLLRNIPNTSFKASSAGTTGFTFLCHMPLHRFVVKWQPLELCNVEHIGSIFFRTLGLPAPQTCVINHKKIVKNLGILAAQEKCAMEAGLDNLSAIYMPFLNGISFKDAIENGLFKNLPLNAQKRMLQEFGKIAIFDMILGNNDRLVSFTDNIKEPLSRIGSFNSGNILIKWNRIDNDIDIYPIDNCTLDLADRKRENHEDVQGIRLLFGEDSDEETKVEDVIPIDYDAKIQRLNQVFAFLIGDPKLVARHIQSNIERELQQIQNDSNLNDDYTSFVKLIPEHVLIGMQEGLKLAYEFKWDEFLSKCEVKDSFSMRAIQLIRNNLALIESLKYSFTKLEGMYA